MADQIAVTCPKCGKEYHLPRSKLGAKAKCSCGNVLVVQEAPSAAPMAACASCGARVYDAELVCPACGKSTRPEQRRDEQRQPEPAAPQRTADAQTVAPAKLTQELGLSWRRVAVALSLLVVTGIALSIAGSFMCGEADRLFQEQVAPAVEQLDEFTRAKRFVIKVTGDEGLSYQGSILVTQPDGSSESRSVSGRVPGQAEATGSMVSCTMQKNGTSGRLALTIERDGAVVKQAETTAPYGVVSAASG